jgi:hypothetical protein
MVMCTLSPSDPPAKPLIIGNKLKAELRREIAHLTAEWKTTICADRKRELERQVTALLALLDGGASDPGSPRISQGIP